MMAVLKRVLVFACSVLIPVVFVGQATVLVVSAARGEIEGGAVTNWGRWLMIGPLFMPVLGLGLVAGAVYQIRHIARNCRLSTAAGWVCAIFLGSVWVLPIYWLIYLRKGGAGQDGCGAGAVG